MTDEEKVAQRYRELGAEEPPRALDDAILAAARREAGARPAPLVTPVFRSGRQRWYAPLATAAVLVLAVAVTLQMRSERSGIESPQQAASPPDGAAAPAETAVPAAPAAREPQPFAANQAADSAGSLSARSGEPRRPDSIVVGSAAKQVEDRIARDAEAAAHAPRMASVEALAKRADRTDRAVPASATAAKETDTPERELERVAQLRAQGRHDEADKALAEFRKRHPDFRIPAAMLERVERR